MKVKKIPMRTCVVTKEKMAKKDLIRVVRTPENTVVVDPTGKVNGHGVYLKKDLEVIERACKTGILNRFLEIEVPQEIYEQLKREIN